MQQTACLVVNPITFGNFGFLFNCTPVGQTSDSMTVLTLRLIYWWDGRGLMLWLLSGPRGLPVGFPFLQYSVLCTVESLYLIYLLFISWFICFWRWCIDKLGVFHANQTSICLDPHLNLGWGWRRETSLSTSVKYCYWLLQGNTWPQTCKCKKGTDWLKRWVEAQHNIF